MTSISAKTQKSQLRLALRKRRKQLSQSTQYSSARRISERVRKLRAYRQAKHIAFYLPNDGEVSALPLIEQATKNKKTCYLPRINGLKMVFHRYQPGDKLSKNRYGILEPLPGSPSISAYKLDLVCLPLVGFDLQGRRLGMGGGFYDRCFSMRQKQHIHSPQLVGLAHHCQQVNTLPAEPWDIPLDNIVSDKVTLRPNTLSI